MHKQESIPAKNQMLRTCSIEGRGHHFTWSFDLYVRAGSVPNEHEHPRIEANLCFSPLWWKKNGYIFRNKIPPALWAIHIEFYLHRVSIRKSQRNPNFHWILLGSFLLGPFDLVLVTWLSDFEICDCSLDPDGLATDFLLCLEWSPLVCEAIGNLCLEAAKTVPNSLLKELPPPDSISSHSWLSNFSCLIFSTFLKASGIDTLREGTGGAVLALFNFLSLSKASGTAASLCSSFGGTFFNFTGISGLGLRDFVPVT